MRLYCINVYSIQVILGGGRSLFTSKTEIDPEYKNQTGMRIDGRNLIQVLTRRLNTCVVKTYPPTDPIVAPLILITFISVTFSNHERNVSYARYG